MHDNMATSHVYMLGSQYNHDSQLVPNTTQDNTVTD